MFYANKDHFAGEWKNDAASGYGILTYANGNRYEGNWLDDKVGSSLFAAVALNVLRVYVCMHVCGTDYACLCCSDTVTVCFTVQTTAATKAIGSTDAKRAKERSTIPTGYVFLKKEIAAAAVC